MAPSRTRQPLTAISLSESNSQVSLSSAAHVRTYSRRRKRGDDLNENESPS